MRTRLHILLMLSLLTVACDLPPLPGFSTYDTSDVGAEPDLPPSSRVCEPNSRRCIANTVRVCSPDGTDFRIDACGVGETCNVASCAPIANTCETDQPFALSATEMAFDVSRDFKSQTKQVKLQNCSDGPIILRDFEVRGPTRPDGTAVFLADTELAQTSIPVGGTVDLKVAYRPVEGLSHVVGRLELSLIVGELTNVEVSLRSKALCVAATPYLDVGMRRRADAVRVTGFIQNCGTEPVTINGWSAPEDVAIDINELPYELPSGANLDFSVFASPEVNGLLDANIDFEVSEPMLNPTVRLRGIAVEPGCVSTELTTPQVVNDRSFPAPGDLVRVRFSDTGPQTYHWLEPLGQPQGSSARLDRVSDGWTVLPRVVGRYRSTLRGYDVASGQPSCEFGEVSFDVRPQDGLHVELTWLSNGDSVPDDTGFGSSANLDLHVLSAIDERGHWNVGQWDCFPGAPDNCGASGGSISASSGGRAEFVHFDEVNGKFQVGVYLSNPFNFRGSLARVRVFRDQTLIADAQSNSLRSANDFWLIGEWDEDTQTWTDLNSVFSGFPF